MVTEKTSYAYTRSFCRKATVSKSTLQILNLVLTMLNIFSLVWNFEVEKSYKIFFDYIHLHYI